MQDEDEVARAESDAVDDNARIADAIVDARATAADGTQGIVSAGFADSDDPYQYD